MMRSASTKSELDAVAATPARFGGLPDAVSEGWRERWYAVQTLPWREFGAASQLRRQGFDVFVPSYWRTVRHARQFRTKLAAFFPGYLFVSLAMGRDRWRSINGTIGVARLIMDGERPRPVLAGIVEDLIALSGDDGAISAGAGALPGDKVRLTQGALAGYVGELLRADADGRVRLLLELMGTRVPVSARGNQIAALSVRDAAQC